MIVIDVGNSTSILAGVYKDKVVERRILSTKSLETPEIRECLQTLIEIPGMNLAVPVIVASVVPAAFVKISEVLADMGFIAVTRLDPGVHQIIEHDLQTPGTTGVDRLLAARAARDFYSGGQAVVVVQAGSAVTVDLVDHEGRMRGGVILPGPGMWMHALSFAAGIPELEPERVNWTMTEPGKSTIDALRHGLAMGLTGAIEKVVKEISKPYSSSRIVITGGWAEEILPGLNFSLQFASDLVLEGIRLVAEDMK